MSKGKFANKRRKNNSSKLIVALLTVVLILSIGIGGTLAWLTAQTTEVTNVFTTSDIGVKLDESYDLDLKMIPGWTIDKDPRAKVTENSEDCYLFVEVTESGSVTVDDVTYGFDDFLTYAIEDSWEKLEDGVYYKIFDSKDTNNTNVKGQEYNILKDDKVSVKETVTKEMMAAVNSAAAADKPALSFKAYAIQLYSDNDTKFEASAAWAKVNPSND